MRPIERIDYDHGNKILVLKPHTRLAEGFIKASSEVAVMHRWPCGNGVDYGVVGRKSITYAFISMLAGTLANNGTDPANITNFKFHALGTGTTPEATTGTGAAIVNEVWGQTRERVQGTQVLALSSPNATYRSVGVITFDESVTGICEHALYNYPTGGTNMDRTLWTGGDVFSVVSGSVVTVTYTSIWLSGG